MKFVFEIDTGNAAFEEDKQAEVQRILKNAMSRVEAGHTDGLCFDCNGNKVGRWYVED